MLPFSSSIGDIEVTITEEHLSGNGETVFEVVDDEVIVQGGHSRLLDLLGHHIFPFVTDAVTAIAASITQVPLLAPLIASIQRWVFKKGGHMTAKMQARKMTLTSMPWWSLQVWNDRPGLMPMRLRVGYVRSPSSIVPGAVTISGKSKYRFRVLAETGTRLGAIRKTGVLDAGSSEFSVDWL